MTRKYFNILIVTLLIPLAFYLGIKFEQEFSLLNDFGKPNYKMETIHFPSIEVGTSLYLKSKTWGITGNHSVSVISTNGNYEFEPDTLSDFCFYDFDEIVYKVEADTLKIFTLKDLQLPPKFNSKVNVDIIKLKHTDYAALRKEIKSGYFIF